MNMYETSDLIELKKGDVEAIRYTRHSLKNSLERANADGAACLGLGEGGVFKNGKGKKGFYDF